MKTKTLSTILATVASIALATACSSSDGSETTDTSSDELKKDPCAACSRDCLTCTMSPGCGWDSRNNKCRSGDVYGPLSKVPNLTTRDWRLGPDFCKDTSATPKTDATCKATSCMACAATTNCGWMVSNGQSKCLPGGRAGPWNVPLKGWTDDWYWNTSDCQIDYMGTLPPGPRCNGNGPPGGGYPTSESGSGSGSSSGTSEEYVCDVSVVFPTKPGLSETFPDYGCAPPSAQESTTRDQQCPGRLQNGASSCTVSNCRPTGTHYVCP